VKKQNKPRGSQTKQVRALDQAALSDASAGTDTPVVTLVDPYIGHQHNETIVRDRARRRSARR
jgi:hypothetical protein